MADNGAVPGTAPERHSSVAGHYTSGRAVAAAGGAAPGRRARPRQRRRRLPRPVRPVPRTGPRATVEVAESLAATPTDHVLDVGSGLGGPARFMAARTGCRVTGIDLTAELCHVAGRLNVATGLAGRVQIAQGSALDLPFRGGTFDAAYSMNVAMNIGDKAGLYREVRRVLRPGGRLVLSEVREVRTARSSTRRRGRPPRRRASSRPPTTPAGSSRKPASR